MNKKGFTLVELLAVIAILGIILTLAVPSLINELRTSKEKTLDKNEEIIISAAKNYMIDNELVTPTSISVATLCSGEYLTCPIVNPVDDSYMVGFVDVDVNKNYIYSTDTSSFVTLTVNLNGGIEKQTFQTSYKVGSVIALIPPTKANYRFTNWSVVGAGSSINGSAIKTLIIGNANTTITANWGMLAYKISYNLNRGTVSSSNPTEYQSNTPTITLSNPTKSNNTFVGWTGSNGNTPQMTVTIPTGSSGNKTYTANWTTYPRLIVDLDYGSGQAFQPSYPPNTEITLTTPSKTGHAFSGWNVTGTGASLVNASTLRIGTGDTTLTASWRQLPRLIVNWSGGSGQTFQQYYEPNTQIALSNPTKSGRTFVYWTVSGTGASLVNASTLKIGTGDTTLTANFAYSATFYGHTTYEVEATGIYTVQLWGGLTNAYAGGGNGYTAGRIAMNKGEVYYVRINVGGGAAVMLYCGAGGGATDLRFQRDTVYDRIMVAAGEGGGGSSWNGASAGGLTGAGWGVTGGGTSSTQTSGYSFGAGQGGCRGGGGGGGYWGGTCSNTYNYGGAGGSSYISGHTGCVAISQYGTTSPKAGCGNGTGDRNCSIHFSNKEFINGTTQLIPGNGSKPAGSNMASITWYSR